MEFGTGGLRGVMGLGTNRMNIYTVRRATQGLASEILDCGADFAVKGVVIAHDSRNNSRIFALEAAKAQSLGTKIPDDFKVVYTPLHGSGNIPVRRILTETGVKNVFVVPEQENSDGNFPTVKSPNPENSEAFDIAVGYAKKQNADLVFGTDPDSDRIGVVVKTADGEYKVLNGNQTGCLLLEYILRKEKENGTLPKNGVVVKIVVTSELVRRIADDYGIITLDVLTGFKFIGEKIKEFENSGEHSFVFGLEESFGYLKGTYARDKDAVVAAMLICEAAADYKQKGMTLYDGLIKLYEKYVFYVQKLETLTLSGIDGSEKSRK